MRIHPSAVAVSIAVVAVGAVLFASSRVGGQEDAGHLACDPAGTSGPAFTDTLEAPLAIPEASPTGVDDCFTISDGRIINDVNVGLGITHTWVGDLIVTLTHEDTGTSVTLVDRPGLPPGTFGCSGDDISIVLEDDAVSAVEDKCNMATPTIAGTFRPNEPLTAFEGERITGTWILNVSDNAGGDTGTLDSWALIPELKDPTPTPTASPSATRTPTRTPTTPPTPEKACGDVNDAGGVSSVDAALILQAVAGLLDSLPNPGSADVNSDDQRDSIDALLVLQFVAGLLDTLDCP